MSGYVHGPGQGDAYDWRGARVVIKASGKDTSGHLAVMESIYPPGLSVPAHIHAGEDEMFYLLEGELRGFCDDQRWRATPGHFVFVPRDRPHGFDVIGDRPARALVIVGPAQLDRQIAATGTPVSRPSTAATPQDEGAAAEAGYEPHPVGWVSSPLGTRADAPKQGDEGAPAAWIVLHSQVRDGLRDLRVGDHVLVLTWLHESSRDVLTVHPRDDPRAAPRGVFSTRSADRPNPIGLHPVTIDAVEPDRIRVLNLEAIDGTPVLDIKPVLGPVSER